MIELKLNGYTQRDLSTLAEVFSTSEAGYWCMGKYDGEIFCQRSYSRRQYAKVCRDITSALSYISEYADKKRKKKAK